MNHALLVQLGVRWLRKRAGHIPRATHDARCSLVFAEMKTDAMECPDVIGWSSGVSHVIEAKVSRADFRADMKKSWMHDERSGMGEFRWYIVPEGLVGIRDVPAWCGLLEVRALANGSHSVHIGRVAPQRVLDPAAYRCERLMLQSACRRHELGTFFDPVTGCWETFTERVRREEAEALERRSQRLARAENPAQLPLRTSGAA